MEYKGLDLLGKVGDHFRYDGECYFYYMLIYNKIPSVYGYENHENYSEEDELFIAPKQNYNLEALLGRLEKKYKFTIVHCKSNIEEGFRRITALVLDFTELHILITLAYDDIGKISYAYDIEQYPNINDIQSIAADIYNIVEDVREDKVRTKMSIYLLDKESYSMKIPFKFNETIDLNKHYNDDFLEINEIVEDWIQDENKNGLIILNGEKGSGKSTYIKHLISEHYKTEDFLFITADGLTALTRKGMTGIVNEFNNKVIILEDCESLLKDRTTTASDSFVPILLNITDGILSNICRCKFIITFNTNTSKIDSALLRKGRCYAQYEFKKLTREKSLALLNELGITPTQEDLKSNGMSLSEIFYHDKKDNNKINYTNKIGFN